ncbi:uncharacterized protein LOC111614469 [Centruroides sculpturatus]|uniref:uncharacterized protein LOC111614469 n=1 Tax=Centruroides sculpturatus TaxID=218467 RepID=UPI000C6E2C14|nr:uncharacterized protein LOC111614469 [Centruroides sculpturatus]
MRDSLLKITFMNYNYQMELENTSEHHASETDVNAEDSLTNIVNAITQLRSDIKVDFPEETELSSDSDDEEEGTFWSLKSGCFENRPLKKKFIFLEKYSLVEEVIYEENEEVEKLVEENNKDKEMTGRNKELIKLIRLDKRRDNDHRFLCKSESDDDDKETTKCFDVSVEVFRRFPSIIRSCLKRKK